MMNRRNLLKTLVGLALTPASVRAVPNTPQRTILMQESPLAGFQYHEGEAVWAQLQEQDDLQLAREPDNRYDERAVAVYWQDRKLGYVPRDENTAIAQMLDRGERLYAQIVRLQESRDPWGRILLSVRLMNT